MSRKSMRGAGLATLDLFKIVLNNSASLSPLTGQIRVPSGVVIGNAPIDGTLVPAGGIDGQALHVGRVILGNSGFPLEHNVAAGLVNTTAFTGSFAMTHSGTYNVGYKVSAYSDTAVTVNVTDTLTLDNVTNIVAGDTVILKGTGADSAKTNTMTVSVVDTTAKTVQFTAAVGTNSYSNRINITSVAYLTSATNITSAGTKQNITASATTGLAVGGLAALVDLTSNGAPNGFATGNTPDIVVIQGISGLVVTLTPNATHTGTYAIVPFTATTSATAINYIGMPTTITLTSGTNFATGLSDVYVWGGTGTGAPISLWDSKTAAAATNSNLIFSRAASYSDNPYTLDYQSINGLWVSVGPGQIATITFS